MSDSAKLKVDTKQINLLFASLGDNKDRKAVVKAGLRKSGNIIKKQAVINMKGISPAFSSMKKDVHVKVYKNASGVRVDILDYRKAGSKAFILKFFELGTKERYTKRKHSARGSIVAANFFNDAVNSKKSESEKSLQQNIIYFINKRVARNAAKSV